MSRSRSYGLVALAALILAVAGCERVASWPELRNVERCDPSPVQIAVEDLGVFFEQEQCDPYGSSVLFPDGTTMPVKEQLTNSQTGPGLAESGEAIYMLVNGGSYGLAAAMRLPGEQVQGFGSEAALEKVQYQDGLTPFDSCLWWWPWPDC